MARLVYGMNVSLDGYVDHDRFAPDALLFAHFIERTRATAGALYGRGLYDLMHYWDGDDWDQDDPAQGDLQAFADAWRALPKWVVSTSLTSVGPNARLVDDVAAVARELKDDRDGDIEVGGPHLAGTLTELGLVDEYHVYLHPVVLGEGRPYFVAARPRLRLTASERIGDVMRLTYVPAETT